MKRPDMETIFSPVGLSVMELTQKVANFLIRDSRGFLTRYYAQMTFDAEEDSYIFCNEQMNLSGIEDLLRRTEENGSCRWACDLNAYFHYIRVSPSVFSIAANESMVLTTIDSGITSYLEEEEKPRIPFATFLVQIASVIGATWFMSGLLYEHWKPLNREKVLFGNGLPIGTYVVGWKRGVVQTNEVMSSLKVGSGEIKRSILDYNFVTFFPEPEVMD